MLLVADDRALFPDFSIVCTHTHIVSCCPNRNHLRTVTVLYLVDLVFTFHILLHVSQDFLEDICPVWTFYAGGWQIQELQLWQLIWQIAPKRSYILKSLVSSRKLRPWKPLSPSACLRLRAIPAFCFPVRPYVRKNSLGIRMLGGTLSISTEKTIVVLTAGIAMMWGNDCTACSLSREQQTAGSQITVILHGFSPWRVAKTNAAVVQQS